MTFYKDFSYCSNDELAVEYAHAKQVWAALSAKNILFPKPVDLDATGIFYEFYELGRRLDHIFHDDFQCAIPAMLQSGKALSCIHSKEDLRLLHGDFVPHNIFFNKDFEIIVIDSHAPIVIGHNINYYYGENSIEYFLFILNIPSSFGIKKAFKNPFKVTQLISNFQESYENSVEFKGLLKAITRFCYIRKQSGFTNFNLSVHVVSAILFLVLANVRYRFTF